MIFALAVTAQVSFSDDFEAYNAGDLLGASSDTWRTWGGQGGGADDAPINSDFANSGTNSLRLTAVGGGGPSDMVLPFGGKYTSGNFHLDFMINVPEGASAYYNFQGEINPGTEWVYNVFMTSDGVINFTGGGNVTVMAATFVPGEWTKMGIDVDINNNVWAFSVNDRCVGSFQNPSNYLASMNLYPTAGDDYYIDDVNMEYTPGGDAFTTDAVLTLDKNILVGVLGGTTAISGTVTNNGTAMIDGFDITYDGTTESFTDQLAAGESATFTMSDAMHSIDEGAIAATVMLSNVDGDENSCNNTSTFVSQSISVTRGKRYIAEEATGTWCQFCPRGDVFMNYMDETYPDLFIGIAVHNQDPMAFAEYDDGLTGLAGFTGFPTVGTERAGFIDPSGLESDFVTRIQEPSPADITIAADYDAVTRKLTINANVEAMTTILPNAGLILVLTEDGVTGTDQGYAQSNAFSGGATVMGGYELLPNPVPAADMVYNHVARATLNGFRGEEFGTGLSAGDTRTFGLTTTLSADWNADNMHIVAIYRAPNGTIPTGASSTILDAEQNDLNSTIDPVLAQNVDVYPNPFSEVTNVKLSLEAAANVSIEVTDSFGRLVSVRDYGTQVGEMIYPINADNLSAGIYFINILAGDSFTSKRVVVNRK